MEINIENAKAAFNTADESVKQVLLALLPELKEETAQKADNRPITERVKTFEDACRVLGDNHQFVSEWSVVSEITNISPDLRAFFKLRIICAALNEGWEPRFTEDEWRYYPWLLLWTEEELSEKSEEWKNDRHLISTGDYQTEDYAGLAYAYSHYAPSNAFANIGSRLCLKSDTLATYCGKQFISLWADFFLIRRPSSESK